MQGTNIYDHPFNPWTLCKGKPRRRTSEANWRKPLRWNRDAEFSYRCECGALLVLNDYGKAEFGKCRCGRWASEAKQTRPRVFCASLADWLDDEVPIEWLADLLKLIHETPNLDWLLLTKRPENRRERLMSVREYLGETSSPFQVDHYTSLMSWVADWLSGMEPSNVWIGTTVENQEQADKRIPELLKIPAKVRFLSCEPLLGNLDLESYFARFESTVSGLRYTNPSAAGSHRELPGIHWVICGGESGPNARPMHPEWVRSLRLQCQAAGVPFFFKQWGEWAHTPDGFEGFPRTGKNNVFLTLDGKTNDGTGERSFTMSRVGKKAAGRILDGREWNEFPSAQ